MRNFCNSAVKRFLRVLIASVLGILSSGFPKDTLPKVRDSAIPIVIASVLAALSKKTRDELGLKLPF